MQALLQLGTWPPAAAGAASGGWRVQLQLRPRLLAEGADGAEEAEEAGEVEVQVEVEEGMEVGGGGRGGGPRAVGLGARRLVRLSLRVAVGGGVLARVAARGMPSEAPYTVGYTGYPMGYPVQGPRREKPAYTDMIAAALLHMEEDGCCTMALGQAGGVSAAALKKCDHTLASTPLSRTPPLPPSACLASPPWRATMPHRPPSLARYMHVNYPAASNAAALKTALKLLVTKGSVLRVRASFRLSEAARASAKLRAHGSLLPLRPPGNEGGVHSLWGGVRGGALYPKPAASTPAAGDASASATGGKRTEGGGYGYRSYGYAGSYGTRPGKPDCRPAAPAATAASSRAARLQTRAPPVLAGRRKYPGEVDPGGELALLSSQGSSEGTLAARQARRGGADRATRLVGAELQVVAGGGVQLILSSHRLAAAELQVGGQPTAGSASEPKGGRHFVRAGQDEGRQPVGTSISGGWRLLASCLLCGRAFLNGGARANHARSCRGNHRPVRLELERTGGGGVGVTLTPQRLTDQQPRELALWACAESGAASSAASDAASGAASDAAGAAGAAQASHTSSAGQLTARAPSGTGYRGVVRLAQGGYRASVGSVVIGVFVTPRDAAAAYARRLLPRLPPPGATAASQSRVSGVPLEEMQRRGDERRPGGRDYRSNLLSGGGGRGKAAAEPVRAPRPLQPKLQPMCPGCSPTHPGCSRTYLLTYVSVHVACRCAPHCASRPRTSRTRALSLECHSS